MIRIWCCTLFLGTSLLCVPCLAAPPKLPHFTIMLPKRTRLEVVRIEKGSFYSTNFARQIKISEGFWIGKYEVTQKQFKVVTGKTPSIKRGGSSSFPVDNVSWDDAMVFCMTAAKLTGYDVQLPTENQWEYACRAGTRSTYYFGHKAGQLHKFAWYAKNSADQAHQIGRRAPNQCGLFDMYGNLWEWCHEVVLRGGGFRDDDVNSSSVKTSLLRDGKDATTGFRVIVMTNEPVTRALIKKFRERSGVEKTPKRVPQM